MNTKPILLQAIRLKNFRGFRDERIELKPLTVLLGPNSAGKSSFGHALAAMTHAHKVYATGPQASLTPPSDDADKWPVDLGKTSDLRTDGEKGSVRIGIETRGGLIEFGFGGLTDSEDLLMSYVSHPSSEQSIPLGIASRVTNERPPLATSSVVPLEQTIHKISTAIELDRMNIGQWREGASEVAVIINGLIVKAVEHRTGTSRKFSGAARDELESLLTTLTYLRATRKRPSRGYKDDLGRQQEIGYGGEWTPSLLHRKGGNKVKYHVPPQIQQVADDAKGISDVWTEKQESLLEGVGAWLSLLDLASAIETVPPTVSDKGVKLRATLKGQKSHDITEIGFGVSQVIPVLVAGLLQPSDSLFIVDLPEAHLHPRPQGAIADFFCSLALSGKSALVETHSEMFFHRLRLRAAQNPSLMDKIAVYFIDEPDKDGFCSKPRPVGLGFQDELRWPEGFLQEGWETEMLINVARQARERSS